jgi:putative thioredoxin
MTADTARPHVFDATTDRFEADVIQRSMEVPVLVDFWATWCGPCKTLGPILEKLAAEYHGAFELAKVDVDREQQLAAAFQIRSVPTVILAKDGQLVDGFPGVLPEGQLREFLKHHGIEPAAADADAAGGAGAASAEPPVPLDPHAEVMRLRKAVEAEPGNDALKLDLALALLATGGAHEAEQLLDALPANLATDDRAVRARARLGFAALLENAPPREVLEAAIASDPADLRARHLLGARGIVSGDAEAGLEQFLEMLRRDRDFEDGLPRKALIDAFRVVDDQDLVGRYRRRMSSLLLA